MQVNLHAAFIFSLFSVASHPRDFFAGLPSLCSGSFGLSPSVESRRVYHLVKDHNTS